MVPISPSSISICLSVPLHYRWHSPTSGLPSNSGRVECSRLYLVHHLVIAPWMQPRLASSVDHRRSASASPNLGTSEGTDTLKRRRPTSTSCASCNQSQRRIRCAPEFPCRKPLSQLAECAGPPSFNLPPGEPRCVSHHRGTWEQASTFSLEISPSFVINQY